MPLHTCTICNFSSAKKCSYDAHTKTKKHINNINVKNNIIIDKIDNLAQQNEEFKKQNEELRQKIEQLEEINKQNTNKIVKEARAIKKSILTILNTNFKDTPSIEYIPENEFIIELEKEYNCKMTDKDDKLIMRIFNDYENKKIVKSISNLIIKFVKKEDQRLQSVFNIDASRGNYATKIEDCWFNDKSGLQLKKYTLEMVINYMRNVLDKFRIKLVKIRAENIKKPTMDKSDYLMKYQSLLLELHAYLSDSNTHKKIILYMCPELRIEQKILESLTK